jgi:hypothetical protein
MRRNQSAKTQDVTQTAAFRRWSKGAPVIQEGAPLPPHGPFVVKAYHGSFADIEAFWTDGPEAPEDDEGEHRIEAGDPNVYWGAHFALEPHVADKFAGVGGDVKWLKLRRGAGSIYPVWLRLENAAVMTEQEMLHLSLTQRLPSWIGDDLTDEVEHYARTLGLDEDAVWDWYEAGGLNPDGNNVREEIHRSIVDAVADWEWSEGTSPHVDLLQDLGNQAKAALQAAGYDSVIYQNEVEGGTSVIVFSPTQIKSAIGNRGTFDPEDPNIRHNPRENQKKATSLIDNLAFQRWFGHSRVVDKRGRPLIVYHGSTKGGFTKFRRGGAGIYFTDCRGVATTYVDVPTWEVTSGEYRKDPTPPIGKEAKAQPGTYAVYLRIEEPLVLDAEGNYFDDLPQAALDVVGIPVDEDMQISVAELAQIARDRGCDGIIVRNVVDTGYNDEVGCDGPSTVYVVFDPRQIKSASVQRGTYDPEDPDIRHNPRRWRR